MASELKRLRQADADLRNEITLVSKQASAIGASALRGKRALNDAERAEFLALGERREKLQDDKAENDTLLAAAETENERERNWRGAMPDPDGDASRAAARRAGFHVDGAFTEASAIMRPRGQRFADLFPQAAAQSDGWDTAGEYLRVVGRGLHDARLRADSMHERQPSAGGFAVPVQLLGTWLDASLENEIVRSRCTTWPMTSEELGVPALDDLDRSDGSIGGMALRFEAELGTMTPQVARLRKINLIARRGAIFLEASNDLVSDAPSFETNISAAMIRVLGFGLDTRFLFGNGAGGPLGALVSPAAIVISRASASHVLYDDVLGMFARLTPGSVARSVWVANPMLIPELATLSVPIGTGGTAVSVMTQADGKFYVLTREVIFSEKMKALGTQGDIALCDFTSYAIGLRKEATLDKSQHVGFARDVETYRLQVRLDGQPTIQAPITPLNGSTLSPFVVLGDPA